MSIRPNVAFRVTRLRYCTHGGRGERTAKRSGNAPCKALVIKYGVPDQVRISNGSPAVSTAARMRSNPSLFGAVLNDSNSVPDWAPA